MKGAYLRICGSVAAVALLAVGCGQILGLDAYEPANSAGAGGSGGAAPGCGNGVVDPGEGCDDGNDVDGDGCTACVEDACFTCVAGAGAPSTCSAKPEGEVCAAGLCNDSGTCVECLASAHCGNGYCFENSCARCNDTLKNGDETDVDCGGIHCPPCAKGKACIASTDCETTFCADGICCGEVCDYPCWACNMDEIGECLPIPKYGEDPIYGMGEACLAAEGEACTGSGGFCLKALGLPCSSGPECASFRCADPDMNGTKTCVKNVGDPCTLPADCYTNLCTNGLCAM